jgi:hypothetical protein
MPTSNDLPYDDRRAAESLGQLKGAPTTLGEPHIPDSGAMPTSKAEGLRNSVQVALTCDKECGHNLEPEVCFQHQIDRVAAIISTAKAELIANIGGKLPSKYQQDDKAKLLAKLPPEFYGVLSDKELNAMVIGGIEAHNIIIEQVQAILTEAKEPDSHAKEV